MPVAPEERIVVIGGGFAGLSAATALAEAGAPVTVLEARSTLGGRASAFTDPVTKERVDNGQHVLFGCYHETFRLLDRIGSGSGVTLQPQLSLDVIDREGKCSTLHCPPLPSPLHLLAGVLLWQALSWRERLSVLWMRAPLADLSSTRVGPSAPREGETVREWLLRHRQAGRLIELLWEPLVVAALNQGIDDAAASAFAGVLVRLLADGSRGTSMGLPVVPLDALYAEPARRYIESHGGTVRCGAKARLERSGTPAGRLVVSVGPEEFDADSVVLAVPWHAIADVVPHSSPDVRHVIEQAARVASSAIVTVNLWLDRPLPVGPVVGLPGRAFQWAFDKGAVVAGTSHVSMVASAANGLLEESNEQIAAQAWRELTAAMPALEGASTRRRLVVRERRATFSLAPGAPLRPSTATDVAGLFLAGDWIDTGLPATIEGAVQSGARAAAAVLQYRSTYRS